MPPNLSPASSVDDLIAYARTNAPFYRQLYAHLPETPKFAELPVIDPPAYWAAHARDRRELLTESQLDGFVLNSGGTTGAPKFASSTAQEFDAAVGMSARSFEAAGLSDGDRVATLFASGNLYASLMFATDSFKRISARVVQFPVGYSVDFPMVAKIIETFRINVLAGFPTHLLKIIDALNGEGPEAARIDHIIYAGELFTPDQQASLQARFPGLRIHSGGYASVEGGPLGYADAGCTGSEHRVFDGATRLEILDEETGEPIDEVGRPGRIIFTALIRRLMPMIRYPTGDRAQWVEPPGVPDRKFRLLGRAGLAARVAGYNLDLAEVAAWLEPLREPLGIEQFQIVVNRRDRLDQVSFHLVGRAGHDALTEGGAAILATFRQRRPDIYESVDAGVMHPPHVQWVNREHLITNPRTGKMIAIVDRRER